MGDSKIENFSSSYSRVLARLASLAQIGELARRLGRITFHELTFHQFRSMRSRKKVNQKLRY